MRGGIPLLDHHSAVGGTRSNLSKGLISIEQKASLDRLVQTAKTDSGGGRRVADFLLAWWNASECGSFDLTNLWGVDPFVASDMVKVFELISTTHNYPDQLGYETDFGHIIAAWRPELVGQSKSFSHAKEPDSIKG